MKVGRIKVRRSTFFEPGDRKTPGSSPQDNLKPADNMGRTPIRILTVVGTRPNFVKVAPLLDEMSRHPEIEATLVHTGQHYDYEMSKAFFEDLAIPAPHLNLGVGSGTAVGQTAEIMMRLERVMAEGRPDVVVVVGDVNSTLAAAITAGKMGLPLAHVEAGLRSFDRTMPEEVNRVLTDAISDYLFVTEPSGVENLLSEGRPQERIYLAGNVMIDALLRFLPQAKRHPIPRELQAREIRAQFDASLWNGHPSSAIDSGQLDSLKDDLGSAGRDCEGNPPDLSRPPPHPGAYEGSRSL